MEPLDFVLYQDNELLYVFDAACQRGRIFYYKQNITVNGHVKWIETDSGSQTLKAEEAETILLTATDDHMFVQLLEDGYSHIYQTETTATNQKVLQEFMNPEECKFMDTISTNIFTATVCMKSEYEYFVNVFVNDQNSYSNLYASKSFEYRPYISFVDNKQLYVITSENIYNYELNEEHPFEEQANVWAKVTFRISDAINTESFDLPVTIFGRDLDDQKQSSTVLIKLDQIGGKPGLSAQANMTVLDTRRLDASIYDLAEYDLDYHQLTGASSFYGIKAADQTITDSDYCSVSDIACLSPKVSKVV